MLKKSMTQIREWDLAGWSETCASMPKVTGSNPSGFSELAFHSDLLLTARGSNTWALVVVACLLCYLDNTLCSQSLEPPNPRLDAGVFDAINALVFLWRKEVVLLYNSSSGPESGWVTKPFCFFFKSQHSLILLWTCQQFMMRLPLLVMWCHQKSPLSRSRKWLSYTSNLHIYDEKFPMKLQKVKKKCAVTPNKIQCLPLHPLPNKKNC
jgi:hypothetical protein